VKILVLSELFWPYVGGAERLGADLVKDLQRQGHELLVITSHDQLELPDTENYGSTPIHRFAFRDTLKSGDPAGVLALRKRVTSLMEDFAPDLIHLYQLGISAFFQLDALCNQQVPLVVSLHNDLYPSQLREKNSLFLRLFHAATWITSCSQSALDQALELDPGLGSKASLIHNGLALSEGEPASYIGGARRLLCLGRLVREKGFDIALQALANIAGRFPDVHLTIAGDGPERESLQKLAAGLRLNGHVGFTGMLAPGEVPELLAGANIVLLPSRREGLPVVALEAACAARPVIASRTGGLAEVVVDRATGLLIDIDATEQLVEKTVDLLTQPELAARMGRAARQRVLDHFSWQGYVQAHLGLYRQLVHNGQHEREAPQAT
jgi:glycogen(starch) synthase